MTRCFAVAAAVAATLLAPASAAAKPAARTATVIVDKLAFGAIPAGLHVGDSILWVNRDIFRHSATVKGQFDIDLPPGTQRRGVIRRAGTYTVVCKFHPGMKAQLKVGR